MNFKSMYYAPVVLLASLTLSGCGNSDVALVKDGSMSGYDTTTIGKAFEASFDKTKWDSFETKKGEKVIEFTGLISEDLHNSVTDEIRDTLESLDDFQKFNLQLNLFQAAVKKLGGENSSYFQAMNKNLNCELHYPGYAGAENAIAPKCQDEKTTNMYMGEVLESFLIRSWEPGTPVAVQWTISVDGESFTLNSMQSGAWDGVTFQNIMNEIYK